MLLWGHLFQAECHIRTLTDLPKAENSRVVNDFPLFNCEKQSIMGTTPAVFKDQMQ